MQIKNRDPHLDVMKGLGILFVICGHLISRGTLWNLIYGFHMPLFVFCSGVVEKDKLNWKRLYKLMVNYIAMAFVACGIYFLICEFGNIYYIKQTIYNVVVGGYSPGHGIYPVEALWFLPSLVVIVASYHLLRKIRNPYIYFAAVLIITILGIYLATLRNTIPMVFNFDVCMMLFPFFAFAPQLKKSLQKIYEMRSIYLAVILCVISTIYYFIVQWNGEINLYRGLLGQNATVFYLGAILGIGDMLCISVLICRFLHRFSMILRALGEHTLLMMGSHQLLILAFRKILPNLHFVILFIIVTLAAFSVSFLFQKFKLVCSGRRMNCG